MLRRALPLLICAVALGATLPAASGQASVESELLNLINRGRDGDLAAHSGLRAMARVHSHEMARDGGLNHNGAAERIRNAPPDPSEQNGPPDDGFTGTWCENVAYVRGAPEHEVAQRIYAGWTNSPSHNRCMNDEQMTAAGVGLFYDGSTNTYWATLESAVDNTLPGSAPATPSPSPSPTPSPTPSPRPDGSPTPAARTEPPTRTDPPEPSERPVPTDRPDPTDPPEPTPRPVRTEEVLVERGARELRRVGDILSSRARTGAAAARDSASEEGLLGAPRLRASSENVMSWTSFGSAVASVVLVAELLRRLSRRRDRSGTT